MSYDDFIRQQQHQDMLREQQQRQHQDMLREQQRRREEDFRYEDRREEDRREEDRQWHRRVEEQQRSLELLKLLNTAPGSASGNQSSFHKGEDHADAQPTSSLPPKLAKAALAGGFFLLGIGLDYYFKRKAEE